MQDPQSGFEFGHAVWTGLLTVAGSFVAFFTKRLVDQVDGKADKTEVEELREGLKESLARQERHHQSNTERLDRIIIELGRKP